jgi:hypothetical protein
VVKVLAAADSAGLYQTGDATSCGAAARESGAGWSSTEEAKGVGAMKKEQRKKVDLH